MERTTQDLEQELPLRLAAEYGRRAQFLREAQARWTQLIRRRRMEEYGDPDSPLPVWPVKPPDVPKDELKRIHEIIEREHGCWDSIERDAS